MPVKLYKTGGQRWIYTCVNYVAVIAVRSPLESLLALEYLIRAYFEACLISCFRTCLMFASQRNAWELRLRGVYFRRSWVFLRMHLADENLLVVGRFDTNVDKLNRLVWVLLVLWSPSPTLSSSLSSPWPSYHCHHHYQLWTECVHIHL